MQKIHQLPQDVIAKIAAGEVIERPVYAVKELVENALDAGATSIAIEINEAGLKNIIVIDNGDGMSKEDLQIAFQLHTTSKISTEEELAHIATLGFRGEALASLAAISQLTLQSRTSDKTGGTSIEILNGEVLKISPIGMPPGTMVTVANLFHSVPGRKKFLKSHQTEFRHIVDFVTRMALARPDIHLSLSHNKKRLFDLSPGTTLERIQKLLGENLFPKLLPLTFETDYVKLTGFIATPQAIGQSKHQYIFINKRSVTDKIIVSAIREAYGTLIDPKSQPIFIISLEIPYELVDINVHPRKETIRFVNNQMIYDAIYKAVMQTLMRGNLLYYNDTIGDISLRDRNRSWKSGTTKTFAGKLLKENQTPWDIRPIEEIGSKEIIQMHNLYLLTQTKYGIAFVDQHAAHERILYEQFLAAFKNEKSEAALYTFGKPIILDLSFTESELLKEHVKILQTVGFHLEYFKDNTFLLHTIPLIFQDRKPKQLLMELLENLQEEKSIKDIDRTSQRMIAYLACRAAIKAGESLTKKQSKDLVEKLEQTPNNISCPHGRPTKIIIDIDKIHRLFKRK